MSQTADATEQAETPEPRQAKARITDPDLLAALEELDRPMADAVRDGLRQELLDDDRGDEGDVSAVPEGMAGRGFRALWKAVDEEDGTLIDVDAAESIVANAVNIKKSAVRSTVFAQLKRRNLIAVSQRVNAVFIVVRDPEEVSTDV